MLPDVMAGPQNRDSSDLTKRNEYQIHRKGPKIPFPKKIPDMEDIIAVSVIQPPCDSNPFGEHYRIKLNAKRFEDSAVFVVQNSVAVNGNWLGMPSLRFLCHWHPLSSVSALTQLPHKGSSLTRGQPESLQLWLPPQSF